MKKQRGVTMIELMIAVILGLGLVAGIGQLFVQSQKSFRLQRNVSDMTDDAAFILESFAKGVLLAGFADDPNTAFTTADANVMSVSGVPNISLDEKEFIHGTDTQLVYRYKLGSSPYGDGNCADTNRNSCELDNFVGTSELKGYMNDIVTVRIYKKNDTDGTPVFYSKAKIEPKPATLSSDTFNAQPLISEVEKLEFRYGIRIKCYENKSTGVCEKIKNIVTNEYKPLKDTFFYATASEVDLIDPDTNKNNWTNVFAVKVFLVMRSTEDKLVKNKVKYKIENVEHEASDYRLYKLFTKTVFLRATDK